MRQLSLKPKTYTESSHVYAAGISVKVSAHYPGRSLEFFFREVSRSHSSFGDYRNEGQNLKLRLMNLLLTELEVVAEVDTERCQALSGSTVRKTGGKQ